MGLDIDGLSNALENRFAVARFLIECRRPDIVLEYDGTILEDDQLLRPDMDTTKVSCRKSTVLC